MMSFYFNFSVSNFFKKKEYEFKNIFCKNIKLSKTKNLEIELLQEVDNSSLIDIDLSLMIKGQDHAGPSLYITILDKSFNIRIYDIRHWNYIKNEWVNDDYE